MFESVLLILVTWVSPVDGSYHSSIENIPTQSLHECAVSKDKYVNDAKKHIYKQYSGIKIDSMFMYCAKQVMYVASEDTPEQGYQPTTNQVLESTNLNSADKRFQDTVYRF